MQASILIGLSLLLWAGQRTEDPNYGLKPSQICTYSIDSWLKHCEKYKGEYLPEYETRGALGTYIEAVDSRIMSLIESKPVVSRKQTIQLKNHLADYCNALYDFEISVSGGGTMYLTFAAFRRAEVSVLMLEMVEGKVKDPGSRKTSDGYKAIDAMIAKMKQLEMDEAGGQSRTQALKASQSARVTYGNIVKSLKSSSRKDSNAVIEFCIKKTKLEVFVQY